MEPIFRRVEYPMGPPTNASRFAIMGCETLLLGLLLFFNVASIHSSLTDKRHEVLYEYPGPAVSERDLPICQPHSVCSIVHRQFWASPVVERLCRCLIRTECPWQWAEPPDNLTMVLDNRSQLKFCDTVTLLPTCVSNVTALTLNLQTAVPIYEMDQENQEEDSEGPKMEVKVSCYCPPNMQWENQLELERNSSSGGITSVTSQYLCKPLSRCDVGDFCGRIRADYYSTYYSCTCPMGHMCINTDRQKENATELLYWGPIMKAYCIPNE